MVGKIKIQLILKSKWDAMSEAHNVCGMILSNSTLWRTQNVSKGLPIFWKLLRATSFLRKNDPDLNFRETVSQYPIWNRPNVFDD